MTKWIRILVITLGMTALVSGPASAQSQLLANAAKSDICGSGSSREVSRLLEAGLVSSEDAAQAMAAAEASCPRNYLINSLQARLVLNTAADMDKPVGFAFEALTASGRAYDNARIVTSMPRIAGLALYYATHNVTEQNVPPLPPNMSDWLAKGGDPNLRLCSGTTLAELLILAKAPNTMTVLAGADGVDFNALTSRALLQGQMVVRYNDAVPTMGLWSFNLHDRATYFFGSIAGTPANVHTNSCVTEASLPKDNLTVFNLALWTLAQNSFVNGDRRAYTAVFEQVVAGGGKPDASTVDMIHALNRSYEGGQALALEKLLAMGFDINTPSRSGQTLIQLAYGAGATPAALKYLVGLGAKLE